MSKQRIAQLFASVVTLAVFLPSLWNGFVHWDDDLNFLQNPSYRGLGAANLEWMFTRFHMGHWHPLTWITLGLDYAIWGMNPLGYHLTSVVLHALSAAVFAHIATRVLEVGARRRALASSPTTEPGGIGVRDRATATPQTIALGAVVSLLWSLHPLRVEAVSWITQRREVLCGLLVLVAVACHFDRRSRWLTGVVAVAAMLAKVTAVTVPIVLILIDLWLNDDRTFVRALARSAKAHALLLVVASAVIGMAVAAQWHAGALVSADLLPPVSRVGIYFYDLGFAFVKSIWPIGLAPLHQAHDPANWAIEGRVWGLAGASFVAIVALFAVAAFRRSRGALALLALFLVLGVPAGGFTQAGPQIAAERYTYQPAWILTLALGIAWTRIAARTRWVGACLAVVGLVVFASLSIRQQRFWRDTETLWKRQLDVYPRSAIGDYQLATFYLKYQHENSGSAEPLLRAAIHESPSFTEASVELGFVLYGAGRRDEARTIYEQLAHTAPDNFRVILLGGILTWERGGREEAVDLYRRLVRIYPTNPEAYRQLARIEAAAGQPRESVATFELGISAAADPILWGDLSWLLATHPDASIRDGRRALALAERAAALEGHTMRMTNILAAACAEAGDFDRGLREVETSAALLPPGQAPALARLRNLLVRREPIRVEPAFP